MSSSDPTRRFSNRVEHYVRTRPGYPAEVVEYLVGAIGWDRSHKIADVGSGTGISAELFLRYGNTVYGVEPNAEMRAAAERLLARYPDFRSIAGTAEATTLANASVDHVTAGQAFHWFEPAATRREFARILKPNGWCVLLWNTRRTEQTPFLQSYEALVREFGTDYGKVRHENIEENQLRAFFDAGTYRRHVLDNAQRLDLSGFEGRLLSSSYLPSAGHPRYEAMLAAAKQAFDKYQVEGEVTVEYDTEIHLGRVTA